MGMPGSPFMPNQFNSMQQFGLGSQQMPGIGGLGGIPGGLSSFGGANQFSSIPSFGLGGSQLPFGMPQS
jgi:hypothetical protein